MTKSYLLPPFACACLNFITLTSELGRAHIASALVVHIAMLRFSHTDGFPVFCCSVHHARTLEQHSLAGDAYRAGIQSPTKAGGCFCSARTSKQGPSHPVLRADAPADMTRLRVPHCVVILKALGRTTMGGLGPDRHLRAAANRLRDLDVRWKMRSLTHFRTRRLMRF